MYLTEQETSSNGALPQAYIQPRTHIHLLPELEITLTNQLKLIKA